MDGSISLNHKGNGTGSHVSGFLSEDVGRMIITKVQWVAHVAVLPEDAAIHRVRAALQFHIAHGPGGHLDANEAMFIGAKHHSDLHPTGYWNGDDVHMQLGHVITISEFTHSGKKGLFLFDSDTGLRKMPADALLAKGLRKGPCAKLVRKQCATTC
jgi:hypothetical protein